VLVGVQPKISTTDEIPLRLDFFCCGSSNGKENKEKTNQEK